MSCQTSLNTVKKCEEELNNNLSEIHSKINCLNVISEFSPVTQTPVGQFVIPSSVAPPPVTPQVVPPVAPQVVPPMAPQVMAPLVIPPVAPPPVVSVHNTPLGHSSTRRSRKRLRLDSNNLVCKSLTECVMIIVY